MWDAALDNGSLDVAGVTSRAGLEAAYRDIKNLVDDEPTLPRHD